MSLIPPNEHATIEEIRGKPGNHLTQRDRIVLALADSPHQPLTAKQVAARVTADGGATATEVANVLTHHPEVTVDERDVETLRYRIQEGSA